MIAIIDYGMGNLRSVEKAFERVGHTATVTGDTGAIADAEKIVLPGVGAFGDAMQELKSRSLVAPVRSAVEAGKPFLGICLGLQLLFERSYEGGDHEGLGIVKGEVRLLDVPSDLKVPHMGWNKVSIKRRAPILSGIEDGSFFYFVHSYYVVPDDSDCIALMTDYGDPFCSMIWKDNVFATQFHPEKSQAEGLRILRNFAELG